MEEIIRKEDIRKLRWSCIIFGVMLVFSIGTFVLLSVWESLIAVCLYLICMSIFILWAIRLDQMIKKHQIMTYPDIRAFLNGKRLDELDEKNRKRYRIQEMIFFIIGFLLIISSLLVSLLLK